MNVYWGIVCNSPRHTSNDAGYRHLAQVQPEDAGGSTVRVAAVAADFAAAMLACRFGGSGSGGIQDIVSGVRSGESVVSTCRIYDAFDDFLRDDCRPKSRGQ